MSRPTNEWRSTRGGADGKVGECVGHPSKTCERGGGSGEAQLGNGGKDACISKSTCIISKHLRIEVSSRLVIADPGEEGGIGKMK